MIKNSELHNRSHRSLKSPKSPIPQNIDYCPTTASTTTPSMQMSLTSGTSISPILTSTNLLQKDAAKLLHQVETSTGNDKSEPSTEEKLCAVHTPPVPCMTPKTKFVENTEVYNRDYFKQKYPHTWEEEYSKYKEGQQEILKMAKELWEI